MVHQLQSNRWSCLPTAFAMVLGVPVKEIIAELGHDGSEIVLPMEKEPTRRRGFHIQELIYYCYKKGYGVIEFQAVPILNGIEVDGDNQARIEGVLKENVAVITGRSIIGNKHAVAWDGEEVVDPNGSRYSIEGFNIESVWVIYRIK